MQKNDLKEVRNIVLISCITVLLIVYAEKTIGFTTGFLSILKPFFIGIAVAFVLDLPMSFIEEKLMSKWDKKKILRIIKRPISMIASIIIVSGIIGFIFSIVLPQVTSTVTDIGERFPQFANDVIKKVDSLTADYPKINKMVKDFHMGNIDWDNLVENFINFLKNGLAGDILSSTFSLTSQITGVLLNIFIAFIFALYALAGKERIKRNIKEISSTYIANDKFNYLYHATTVLIENFKRFVAGQCIESIIIGVMFMFVMTLLKLPYAVLISVFIAFCALIPMIGYYIGMVVGAFFILMVDPLKMIEFLIMFFILQQFEVNVIYPRTVGNSVGLPAILVFSAVIIGGGIAGIGGMLISIPITSTVYFLVKDDVRKRRLAEKQSIKPAENNPQKSQD